MRHRRRSRRCRCPTSTAGTATRPDRWEWQPGKFFPRCVLTGHHGPGNGAPSFPGGGLSPGSSPSPPEGRMARARGSAPKFPMAMGRPASSKRPHLACARVLAGDRYRRGPVTNLCHAGGEGPLVEQAHEGCAAGEQAALSRLPRSMNGWAGTGHSGSRREPRCRFGRLIFNGPERGRSSFDSAPLRGCQRGLLAAGKPNVYIRRNRVGGGYIMGIRKQIEFEISDRTYRVRTNLDNTYDIHGFNSLSNKVSIETDLNTGEKLFISWGQIPVLRFIDAPDDDA